MTEQMMEQLCLLANGYSLAEIAEHNDESLSATKRRQTNILMELGARNGTHAVALGLRGGQIV